MITTNEILIENANTFNELLLMGTHPRISLAEAKDYGLDKELPYAEIKQLAIDHINELLSDRAEVAFFKSHPELNP